MHTFSRVAAKAGALTVGIATAALLSFAPAANALTYTTSGAPEQVSLGDTIGSTYDELTIGGENGTFSAGIIDLDYLTFTAGVNATIPENYPSAFSFLETLTLSDGSGTTLTIPFSLNISYSDTLTIIGGTTFSFVDNGITWQLIVNGLTIGPNFGGPEYATLTAQVIDPPGQTPLPGTLPLFAAGLGVMGLFGWRRKRKDAALATA